MDIRITSADLITSPNPPSGQLQLGFPLSGAYANAYCKKDSTGTITPIGGSMSALPGTQLFNATSGQTVFTPAGFVPTTSSKVYQGGTKVYNTVHYDLTTNPGSVTFLLPQDEFTQISIDEF